MRVDGDTLNRVYNMRTTSFIAALLLSLLMAGTAEKANAGVFVSITVAPPALPVYVQPPVPGPGYMWTPGYWAWDGDAGDYFWVPGAWVPAPEPGLLWTPGYWGWSGGVYAWNAGYWGPHVGFYGGVSYGFGYTGVGFGGGVWVGGVFSYNRAVMNVGLGGGNINVYNKTVINNNVTHVSFNGGNGGIQARPNAEELAAAHEHHVGPTGEQLKHHDLARKNPDLKYANNHGKPAIAATSKAGDFSKAHAIAAKSAGNGFKPASLKTQGSSFGNKANTGTQRFGGANGAQGANTQKGNIGSKNAALTRRPAPPPHPANRPMAKTQPGKDNKKPH